MTTVEEYQDLYLGLWKKQMVEDRRNNKNVLVKGPSQKFLSEKTKDSPEPKVNVVQKPKKLTKMAILINRMLQQGLTVTEIAKILGVTRQNISFFKSSFELPRSE